MPVVARVRAWDLAATEGTAADYTVGVRMSRTSEGIFYVEDVLRGRWLAGDRDKIILQTAQLDGRAVQIVVEQEPGSAGKSQTAGMVRLLAGYAVSGERPTGPKAVRAQPFASQARVGNVRLVQGAWNSAYLNELVAFDAGAHDDQVDASSAAFEMLTRLRPAAPAIGPQRQPAAGYRPMG